MAWIETSTGGATNCLSASIVGSNPGTTGLVATLNKQAGVGANLGDLLVVSVCGLNGTSTDGDDNAVASVADSKSNTWVKSREWTKGAGGAGSGHFCSVWYTGVNVAALTTTDTVTATFNDTAHRNAQCMMVHRFQRAGGLRNLESTYTVSATSTFPAVDLTETGNELLRIRSVGAKTTSLLFSQTSGGWLFAGTTKASASIAAASALFVEYRIVSAATCQSAPKLASTAQAAHIYTIFSEDYPIGQTIL